MRVGPGLGAIALVASALTGCGSSDPSTVKAESGPCSFQRHADDTGSKSAPGLPAQPTQSTGTATISLTLNDKPVVISVDAAKTPCTLASFAHLAQEKFYDGTTCHRLTTAGSGISVLQCGDPTGTGRGGPGYTLPEENLGAEDLPAGTVAMAKTSAPHSTGSQFFLCYGDTPLPPEYTPFGTITTGLDVVQAIGAAGTVDGGIDGAPKEKVTIGTLIVSAS